MPDRDAVLRALHCRGQDLMIDPPACDQCEYRFQMPDRCGCDFRRLCRDAAELIGNLDRQIRELESAHAGAEELLRQKTILFDDAIKRLEKLKEQEHGETFTVIDTKTRKEADEYEIALHEDWAKHLCYCDMDGWAIMDDGSLLLVDECGRCAYADRERFKVKWE